MAGFIGALGGSGVPTAEAVEGDICQVDVDSRAVAGEDGEGNDIYVIERGVTYGLVFRVEDDEDMELAVFNPDLEGEPDVIDFFDGTGSNVDVQVDSETGSGRIVSQAEVLTLEGTDIEPPDGGDESEWDVPNVGHALVSPGVLSQAVDTMSARFFNDSDGNPLNSINAFLDDNDYPEFADDAPELCGEDTDSFEVGEGEGVITEYFDESWGFIDFECIEAGFFNVHVHTPDDTEEEGVTLKFLCGGQADTATIATQRTQVETQPTGVAPGGFGTSVITVTVLDQFGDRIDGVEVTFSTDNCQFRNTDPVGDTPISPAGGGTTVTTLTDSDDAPGSDADFLANNPLQLNAGTAEALLNCMLPGSSAGVAHITAVVQRPGSDIVLEVDVAVVGPTAATGLSLMLSPDELDCGETLKATAKAVDANGNPVSNGTVVHFTTDTSSGVVGGQEGAQGQATTIAGVAEVLIATDPGNPGTHTVIAFVMNNAGTPSAQASATYECEGDVAPAAPVAPPGTIAPPSTGDAGLADGTKSASALFVIAGAVAFVLAGLVSVKFART
jgi:hypothetical protein